MKKIIFLFLSFTLCIITLCGCYNKNDVKLGKYITEGELHKQSYVILSEDNEFSFSLNLASSYLPTGTFNIEDDKLILYVSDNEKYIFNIEGNKLIFQSGELAEKYIELGTEFTYTSKK